MTAFTSDISEVTLNNYLANFNSNPLEANYAYETVISFQSIHTAVISGWVQSVEKLLKLDPELVFLTNVNRKTPLENLKEHLESRFVKNSLTNEHNQLAQNYKKIQALLEDTQRKCEIQLKKTEGYKLWNYMRLFEKDTVNEEAFHVLFHDSRGSSLESDHLQDIDHFYDFAGRLMTPLMIACKFCYEKTLVYLIHELNMNCYKSDIYGATYIKYAITYGYDRFLHLIKMNFHLVETLQHTVEIINESFVFLHRKYLNIVQIPSHVSNINFTPTEYIISIAKLKSNLYLFIPVDLFLRTDIVQSLQVLQGTCFNVYFPKKEHKLKSTPVNDVCGDIAYLNLDSEMDWRSRLNHYQQWEYLFDSEIDMKVESNLTSKYFYCLKIDRRIILVAKSEISYISRLEWINELLRLCKLYNISTFNSKANIFFLKGLSKRFSLEDRNKLILQKFKTKTCKIIEFHTSRKRVTVSIYHYLKRYYPQYFLPYFYWDIQKWVWIERKANRIPKNILHNIEIISKMLEVLENSEDTCLAELNSLIGEINENVENMKLILKDKLGPKLNTVTKYADILKGCVIEKKRMFLVRNGRNLASLKAHLQKHVKILNMHVVEYTDTMLLLDYNTCLATFKSALLVPSLLFKFDEIICADDIRECEQLLPILLDFPGSVQFISYNYNPLISDEIVKHNLLEVYFQNMLSLYDAYYHLLRLQMWQPLYTCIIDQAINSMWNAIPVHFHPIELKEVMSHYQYYFDQVQDNRVIAERLWSMNFTLRRFLNTWTASKVSTIVHLVTPDASTFSIQTQKDDPYEIVLQELISKGIFMYTTPSSVFYFMFIRSTVIVCSSFLKEEIKDFDIHLRISGKVRQITVFASKHFINVPSSMQLDIQACELTEIVDPSIEEGLTLLHVQYPSNVPPYLENEWNAFREALRRILENLPGITRAKVCDFNELLFYLRDGVINRIGVSITGIYRKDILQFVFPAQILSCTF